MTLRTAIIEDEEAARAKLRQLVSTDVGLNLAGEAGDGLEAVALIDRIKPDLVFLDIEMPGISGIDVLRRIRHRPLVIFTTAYDRYAVSAFELHALDYLLKPFGHERFAAAVERARKTLPSAESDTSVTERVGSVLADSGNFTRIFVRDRGKITPVLVKDIERLEAEDDYVAVLARGRRHLVYLPLAEFEQRLDPAQFLRIHRAHLVNLDFVSHLEPFDGGRLRVTMRDGTMLMASRIRSKELRNLAI